MTIEDLALLFTRGIGSRGAAHLIDCYGSAEAVFSASRSSLINDAELREELADRIRGGESFEAARREVAYCRKHDIRIVAATDKEYPTPLREIADRPHILFVRGNVDALNMRTLSMVGTRDMSPAGEHVCHHLISTLARSVADLCVVSGLAYGIDSAAHRSALLSNVVTVAVVANTLPDVNPVVHRHLANDIIKHDGAVISELHSASRQNGSLFIARNRIIAGISMGTLVVESPASGGSLATANFADGYNRVVMAVPGRITDPMSFGTNNLIRSGKARLVMTANDIIDEMGWCNASPARSPENVEGDPLANLTPQQRTVLEAIGSTTTIDWAQLLARTGLSMGELSMVILDLEMEGLIRCLPGKCYERV